jgi:acyl-CoA dehydrogenase
MSVPYELLNNSQNGHIPASERIPVIARPFVSERAAKTLDIVSCVIIFEIMQVLTYQCR